MTSPDILTEPELATSLELKRPLGGAAVRERLFYAETVEDADEIGKFRTAVLGAPKGDVWADFDDRFIDKELSERHDIGVDATRDAMGAYLRSIAGMPLLTQEGEEELTKRIEAGLYAGKKLDEIQESKVAHPDAYDWALLERMGIDAKNMLIEANLKLVVAFTKRFMSARAHTVPMIDLVKEGNFGLIRAIEKFDYTKGYKFSTYAEWWVRQAVDRAIGEQSRTIRVPYHIHEELIRFSKTKNKLRHELERDATPEEIAASMNVDVSQVSTWEEIIHRQPVSLDVPLSGEEDGAVFGDILEDRNSASIDDVVIDEVTQNALPMLVERALAARVPATRGAAGREGKSVPLFTPQERLVLAFHYGLDGGEPLKQVDIAKRIGVVSTRVSTVIRSAERKLRDHRHLDEIKALEVYHE